jgi:hypothetical protein
VDPDVTGFEAADRKNKLPFRHHRYLRF